MSENVDDDEKGKIEDSSPITNNNIKSKSTINDENALLQNKIRLSTAPDDSPMGVEQVEENEDKFMFKKMKKKLRQQLSKFKNTQFKKHNKDFVIDIPIERQSSTAICLKSAFHVIEHSMYRDESNRKELPFITGLLDVSLSWQSNDVSTQLSTNPILVLHLNYFNGFLKWTVYRRVYDIFRLYTILMWHHFKGNLTAKIPNFPNQLKFLVDTSKLKLMSSSERNQFHKSISDKRKSSIETFFKDLFLSLSLHQNCTELFEFIELSRLSLTTLEPGRKLKEGYLKNRIFETQKPSKLISLPCSSICMQKCVKKYRTTWFIVRSSFIASCDQIDQESPSDVILLDKNFHVLVENEHTSNFLRPVVITIVNSSRKLELRPESNSQIDYWLEDIRKIGLKSIWTQPQRFSSFAPIRKDSQMKWLVDGHDYFELVADYLENAEKEIFLHGWWISPELYLKRPSVNNESYRLDRLLKRKAEQGVNIYILIFKELTFSLPINSYYTKTTLERLHPNIRVQRHPDALSGVIYWAHHEKIVVVDQNIAFLGGIDLCYGRYDDVEHSLIDIDSKYRWTGPDYSNPRIKDFRNVDQFMETLLDRTTTVRMPWHDIHSIVNGTVARDAARHFIERWNFVKQRKSMHKEIRVPFLLPNTLPARLCPIPTQTIKSTTNPSPSPSICCSSIQLIRSVCAWSMGSPPEHSIYEAYLHYIKHSQHFIYIENQFFISKAHLKQNTPVKNRIAMALVERIIRAWKSGHKFRVIVIIPLMPAFEAPLHSSDASALRMIMQLQYNTISRGPNCIIGCLEEEGVPIEEYISFLSLRKHAQLDGKAVTEQLYVHSKLMIVDDQVALIGSANINDRSMLGMRDSEVDMIVEASDEDKEEFCFVPGKYTMVSPTVVALRKLLLQEHLGLLDKNNKHPSNKEQSDLLGNPLDDNFYHKILLQQAKINTQIYRELFHCVPDDCVDGWDEYRRFTGTPRQHVVNIELGINSLDRLDSIKGHIVQFPLYFMKNDDLSASVLAPEFLLPIEVYL